MILLALLAFGVQHAAATVVALGASAQPPQTADRIQITLERTACFGPCPIYSVTLSGDGTVQYEGQEFVRVAGRQNWKVDPNAVAALAREMEAAGYFALEDRYTEDITDLPTTRTSLRIGARLKRIEDYVGAPDALKRVERRIEEVAGVKKVVIIDGTTLRRLVRDGLSLDSTQAQTLFANAVRSEGAPAILHARGGEVYRLLLGAGESAGARDSHGVTPLHHAASMGDPDAVSVLLTAGADVNGRNSDDETPLMEAAGSGSAETVLRLLYHGADRSVRDSRGHTALQYAQDGLSAPNLFGPNEFAQIVSLLNGHGR